MIKKMFSIIGVVSLIGFSFYYTKTASDIIKRNDPIMKEIVSVSKDYIISPTDAVLVNNNIMPGISGVELDINKSYDNMKKYGSFNEKLLVTKKVKPNTSVDKIYNKYIKEGNNQNKNISLVFLIENTDNLDKLLTILNKNNTKVSFFIKYDLLNDEILNKIENHEINILDKDKILEKRRKLKTINDGLCYTEKEDNDYLRKCSDNKMHTIIPSLIIKEFPYGEIKNNLRSGLIIKLNINNQTIRELNSIINYINQKGYKLVTLTDLITE